LNFSLWLRKPTSSHYSSNPGVSCTQHTCLLPLYLCRRSQCLTGFQKILNWISAWRMERKRCWDIWFELLIRDLVVASILSYLWLYHMELSMLSSLNAVFTYLSSNHGICAVPFIYLFILFSFFSEFGWEST